MDSIINVQNCKPILIIGMSHILKAKYIIISEL